MPTHSRLCLYWFRPHSYTHLTSQFSLHLNGVWFFKYFSSAKHTNRTWYNISFCFIYFLLNVLFFISNEKIALLLRIKNTRKKTETATSSALFVMSDQTGYYIFLIYCMCVCVIFFFFINYFRSLSIFSKPIPNI